MECCPVTPVFIRALYEDSHCISKAKRDVYKTDRQDTWIENAPLLQYWPRVTPPNTHIKPSGFKRTNNLIY